MDAHPLGQGLVGLQQFIDKCVAYGLKAKMSRFSRGEEG